MLEVTVARSAAILLSVRGEIFYVEQVILEYVEVHGRILMLSGSINRLRKTVFLEVVHFEIDPE